MSNEKCVRCEKVADVWTRVDDLKRLMDVYDSQIEVAVATGVDQGRILGLLEAATALEKAGYGELGDVVRRMVNEDLILYTRFAGEA
jgi:hypothetical protein